MRERYQGHGCITARPSPKAGTVDAAKLGKAYDRNLWPSVRPDVARDELKRVLSQGQ
jgi:hypothetical protein